MSQCTSNTGKAPWPHGLAWLSTISLRLVIAHHPQKRHGDVSVCLRYQLKWKACEEKQPVLYAMAADSGEHSYGHSAWNFTFLETFTVPTEMAPKNNRDIICTTAYKMIAEMLLHEVNVEQIVLEHELVAFCSSYCGAPIQPICRGHEADRLIGRSCLADCTKQLTGTSMFMSETTNSAQLRDLYISIVVAEISAASHHIQVLCWTSC